MNKKDKDRAWQIFEKSDFDMLYITKKGNFFSTENLAKNSVMKEVNEADRKLEKLTRNSLSKEREKDVLTKTIKNKT